ncbi:DUF2321 domain-containing protein [Brevundimonas sp.]|uniref:DUF2321 domain-containing protein n=1 Tax=Brevundimonas sp. TaxID=1871086 RepID=UPI0028AB23ED|nr:DUF2321 domain-containing protein [Brevundimonas sp.]
MGYYDQMQVCLNGHQITDRAREYAHHRAKHCKTCGAATIDSCTRCNAPIKGDYVVEGVLSIGGYPTPIPNYCENCGGAFPWQEAAIENLREILNEGDLSEADMTVFENAIPDVIRETPKTESASLRLKRVMGGLGKPVYDVAIKVVSDIASETAKKTMGLA